MRKYMVLIISVLVVFYAFSYILVSIKPLKLILKELTSKDVLVLINPRTNPHMFSLTPSSIRKIKEADMLIVLGYGFEEWISRIRGNMCIAGRGLEKIMKENAHVWLDPELAKVLAKNIEGCLEKQYPQDVGKLRENLSKFLKKLDDVEKRIKVELKGKKGVVLELRPALWHFAKRFYEGRYESILSKTEASIAPKKLRYVMDLCIKHDIKYLIVEKASNKEIARPVLRECNLKMIEADVLGVDTESYFDMLEKMELVFEKVLR